MNEWVPSAKDTLAPVVVKILKQCYLQNLLSLQKCESVLETTGCPLSYFSFFRAYFFFHFFNQLSFFFIFFN